MLIMRIKKNSVKKSSVYEENTLCGANGFLWADLLAKETGNAGLVKESPSESMIQEG